MDRRGDLMLPNSQGDYGLHPNDVGHAVIAEEFMAALLGN
jgi:hypothetical protein